MRKSISILMLLCLLPLAGCTAKADQRTGEAEGYGGKLKVSVTMNGTDITEVKVIEHAETPGVGTRAIEALPEKIIQADSVDVTASPGPPSPLRPSSRPSARRWAWPVSCSRSSPWTA